MSETTQTQTESTKTAVKAKGKKSTARELARERGRVKKSKEPAPKNERVPRPDLVVFAFRLTKEQRDTIHTAAGPAKASQFVLNAALAAAAKKAQ
jgi:hypothetical protein